MSNQHIWDKYYERKYLPIIRVEDIVFRSKYGEVKIAIREEEHANTAHPPLYYTSASNFTNRDLLRREVSTWALSTFIPGGERKVKPFIEVYLKPINTRRNLL